MLKGTVYLNKNAQTRLDKWESYGLLIKEKIDRNNVYFPTLASYFLKHPEKFSNICNNYEDFVFGLYQNEIFYDYINLIVHITEIPGQELTKYLDTMKRFKSKVNKGSRGAIYKKNKNENFLKSLKTIFLMGETLKGSIGEILYLNKIVYLKPS